MRQTCSRPAKAWSMLHKNIITKGSSKMGRGMAVESWCSNQATFMKGSGQMVRKTEEESIMTLRSNSAMKESGRMGKEKDSDTFISTITALFKELFLKTTKMDKGLKNCITEIHTEGNT